MMTNKTKLLIALEGAPGSGKTSLMQRLDLRDDIEGVVQILPDNDPTDTTLTLEKILKSDQLKTRAFQESPRRIIVLDRYYQSTLAYHWASDHVYHEDHFDNVRRWMENSLEHQTLVVPDVTFYVDVPFNLSLSRKGRTAIDEMSPWTNRIFLEKMREYYRDLQRSSQEKIIFIDGTNDLAMIETEIMNMIHNYEKRKISGDK